MFKFLLKEKRIKKSQDLNTCKTFKVLKANITQILRNSKIGQKSLKSDLHYSLPLTQKTVTWWFTNCWKNKKNFLTTSSSFRPTTHTRKFFFFFHLWYLWIIKRFSHRYLHNFRLIGNDIWRDLVSFKVTLRDFGGFITEDLHFQV